MTWRKNAKYERVQYNSFTLDKKKLKYIHESWWWLFFMIAFLYYNSNYKRKICCSYFFACGEANDTWIQNEMIVGLYSLKSVNSSERKKALKEASWQKTNMDWGCGVGYVDGRCRKRKARVWMVDGVTMHFCKWLLDW